MNKHWFLISLMRMADGQVFNTKVQGPDYESALIEAIRKTDPSITGATRNAFSVLLAVEDRTMQSYDNVVNRVALNSGARWV